MKTDAQTYERVGVAAHQNSDSATEINDSGEEADAARAADNILQWSAYLPPDCIKAMISMGWDRTT
jgi:hypothetical protein